jgi:hypothetical protein
MPLDSSQLQADKSWSFADCTQRQTRYITHGYHTYPAKFIPQLAARLIRELTLEGETVADPFMGSGTTVVEALVQARRAIGVDINPVAHLVAKVKSTPIEPALLKQEYANLSTDLETQLNGAAALSDQGHLGDARQVTEVTSVIPQSERIDYWFPQKQKERLGVILGRITEVQNKECRDLFLVAFSQILKSCSIWLQKSVKPTRDLNKAPAEPLAAFLLECPANPSSREYFALPSGGVR